MASTRHGDEARYRSKLLKLLSAATFFEGYDGFVLPFVLVQVLHTFHGGEAMGGVLRAVVTTGTVAAFFLASQIDRIGRRKLLLITVTGYTIATALTVAAPSIIWFAATQFLAQIFLGAEWAAA